MVGCCHGENEHTAILKEDIVAAGQSKTPIVLKKYANELLEEWISGMSGAGQDGKISGSELRAQAKELLELLPDAARHNNFDNLEAAEWQPVREFLDGISRSRAQQGFTSAQTATFIFPLKNRCSTACRLSLQRPRRSWRLKSGPRRSCSMGWVFIPSRHIRNRAKTSSIVSRKKCSNSPRRW
jgi:hypothetical protein